MIRPTLMLCAQLLDQIKIITAIRVTKQLPVSSSSPASRPSSSSRTSWPSCPSSRRRGWAREDGTRSTSLPAERRELIKAITLKRKTFQELEITINKENHQLYERYLTFHERDCISCRCCISAIQPKNDRIRLSKQVDLWILEGEPKSEKQYRGGWYRKRETDIHMVVQRANDRIGSIGPVLGDVAAVLDFFYIT